MKMKTENIKMLLMILTLTLVSFMGGAYFAMAFVAHSVIEQGAK